MARKDELLKLARLLQAQADTCGRGPVKLSLRKLANHYRQEAERIRPGPSQAPRNNAAQAAWWERTLQPHDDASVHQRNKKPPSQAA